MWFQPRRGKYGGQPRGGSKPFRYVPLKELEREADKGGAKQGTRGSSWEREDQWDYLQKKECLHYHSTAETTSKAHQKVLFLVQRNTSVANSDQVVNVTFLTCPLDLSSLCDVYRPSYFLNFCVHIVSVPYCLAFNDSSILYY